MGCCPMGTLRNDGVVECYWYGVVTTSFCKKCMIENGKELNDNE